jgi:hypothetical protein
MPKPDIVNVRPAAELAAQIAEANAEHRAGLEAVRKGLGHFRKVGDILLRLKAGRGHGKWQEWFKNETRFVFDLRSAQHYMRIAKRWEEVKGASSLGEAIRLTTEHQGGREEGEPPDEFLDRTLNDMGCPADPTLIPEDGHLLLFVHKNDELWVEPSEHAGYYYVTMVYLATREDERGVARGLKRPIVARMVPYTVRKLGAEITVSLGKRIEAPDDECPRNYNRWLYDSYEAWQERWLSPEEDD